SSQLGNIQKAVQAHQDLTRSPPLLQSPLTSCTSYSWSFSSQLRFLSLRALRVLIPPSAFLLRARRSNCEHDPWSDKSGGTDHVQAIFSHAGRHFLRRVVRALSSRPI